MNSAAAIFSDVISYFEVAQWLGVTDWFELVLKICFFFSDWTPVPASESCKYEREEAKAVQRLIENMFPSTFTALKTRGMFDRILVKFYGFRMSIKTGGRERSGPLTPATGPTERPGRLSAGRTPRSHTCSARSGLQLFRCGLKGDLDPAAAPLMKHFPHSRTS